MYDVIRGNFTNSGGMAQSESAIWLYVDSVTTDTERVAHLAEIWCLPSTVSTLS